MITSKAQITMKALQDEDEIVVYRIGDHVNAVKLRIIDGKKVYILDSYNDDDGLKSTRYPTLNALKNRIVINIHKI